MSGLCSHIATIDFVAISGKKCVLEYTDYLHEAFKLPSESPKMAITRLQPLQVLMRLQVS